MNANVQKVTVSLFGLLLTVLSISAWGGGVILGQKTWTSGNGHEYAIVEFPNENWNSAALDITTILPGYHLATITSQPEQDFIWQFILDTTSQREWWLGGFQPVEPEIDPAEGWVWTTGEPWTYTNWASGEPNNANGIEDHLAIQSSGTWNDCCTTLGGTVRAGYIAEFSPGIQLPPVADAGGPYSGTIDVPVTFDGTGSLDPDGSIVTYVWDFGDGSAASGVTTSHSYGAAGVYNVTLTVTDNDGVSNSGVTTVVVSPNTQLPPVADAGGPYEGAVGADISFDGSGSNDADGAIVSYDWNFGDSGTGTGSTPIHTYSMAGVYDVTLTVTDNSGLSSSDDTVAVVVGMGTAIDSRFIADPAISRVSANVTMYMEVSAFSPLGSDSVILYNFYPQRHSGSAGGYIESTLNDKLVFTDLDIKAYPNETLSMMDALLGFPISVQAIINSIHFELKKPSQDFPLSYTDLLITRGFGPGSMPIVITIEATIKGWAASDNLLIMDKTFSSTVSVPVSGEVSLDSTDLLPNRFFISVADHPMSSTFFDSGVYMDANWTADGVITVKDFVLTLKGSAIQFVDLGGAVKTPDGNDICAMVLASGQFMFSCNPMGDYSLTSLPTENDGTVKRQIYADGFLPKIDILTSSRDEEVIMTRSGSCPSYNTDYDPGFFPDRAGKKINISGAVLLQDSQTPVCALVLANGQYIFSCDGTGSYALNIPLDTNGQFKLQVYADGFAPTIQTFDEFKTTNNVRMARAAECQ